MLLSWLIQLEAKTLLKAYRGGLKRSKIHVPPMYQFSSLAISLTWTQYKGMWLLKTPCRSRRKTTSYISQKPRLSQETISISFSLMLRNSFTWNTKTNFTKWLRTRLPVRLLLIREMLMLWLIRNTWLNIRVVLEEEKMLIQDLQKEVL